MKATNAMRHIDLTRLKALLQPDRINIDFKYESPSRFFMPYLSPEHLSEMRSLKIAL